ncbi:MAG: MFS transporter [Lachnospiraceae bacterium]|nr:MFS transporter [Lachnospiraceae bacterium]
MTHNKNYNRTIYACFIGYVVQAIINNFIPLLFLTFHSSYNIPLSQITLLVTFNFGLQLIIDFVSPGFIDKIGYKASIMLAQAFCAAGLLALTILPEILPNAFVGLLLSVMIYALGGGLLEVLVSPIMEACPTDNKAKAMSLLHSFYCWGHVAVVLLSTVFFQLFGIQNWRIMAIIWALVPIANFFLFGASPVPSLSEVTGKQLSIKDLLKQKIFWVFIILMVCAGACEQAVSQWASTFAEKGLGISKTAGDLAGPMLFAILMGTSRLVYGKWGEKINLEKFMYFSGILCLVSYLIISLSPWPFLSLIGCGICGLSVGILWPGTFSMATKDFHGGSTAMFAFFALAGDLGCGGGPTFVGFISGAFHDDLKMGVLVAIIFPVLLLAGLFIKSLMKKKEPPLKA